MRILLALALGISLNAFADSSVPDNGKGKGKKEAKAKPGGACKANDDCDQTNMPQICVDKKCEVNVPPPT
jgi:hypothetical protein